MKLSNRYRVRSIPAKWMATLLFIWCCFSWCFAQEITSETQADSLFTIGDYSAAAALYNELPEAELKLARSLEAIGQSNRALTAYASGLEKHPEIIWARFRYGLLLGSTGKIEKADSVFRRLSTEYPEQPSFQYQLGLLNLKKDKTAEALENFKRTLSLDPQHQKARYRLARYYIEKRAFNTAELHIDAGLLEDPENRDFRILMALRYFYTENYHEAADVYESLLAEQKGNTQFHENLAVCYQNTNRFEQAIEQLTILINEYDDKNPDWHYQIGRSYSSLRDYEKAKRHYEIAVVLKWIPKEREYMALSYILGKQENFAEQREVLNKAIEENPDNQYAYYLLATAVDSSSEDKTKAIPYYERYLERFGDEGRFSQYAKYRIKDIKTEAHFTKEN